MPSRIAPHRATVSQAQSSASRHRESHMARPSLILSAEDGGDFADRERLFRIADGNLRWDVVEPLFHPKNEIWVQRTHNSFMNESSANRWPDSGKGGRGCIRVILLRGEMGPM